MVGLSQAPFSHAKKVFIDTKLKKIEFCLPSLPGKQTVYTHKQTFKRTEIFKRTETQPIK